MRIGSCVARSYGGPCRIGPSPSSSSRSSNRLEEPSQEGRLFPAVLLHLRRGLPPRDLIPEQTSSVPSSLCVGVVMNSKLLLFRSTIILALVSGCGPEKDFQIPASSNSPEA